MLFIFSTYDEELDYLIDKVENPANDKTWIDAIADLGSTNHPDVLRKSWTGGRWSGYQVAKHYRAKMEQGCTSEEINRLEVLKDEIYKERCRISDINRVKNNSLRESARFETLLDTLKREMNNLEPIVINAYKPCISLNKVTAVAQFSDWHIGKLIDNQWNIYNNEIATRRANIIADKIIDKSKLHNVTDLIVEVNGDMVDGLIQVSARNAEENDVISQILFVSELLSQIINKLKPYYENIKVVTTLGNHGRLYTDRKAGLNKENFEMLIPEFLKLRLGDTVSIIKSYGFDFTAYEIGDKFICLAHGQNDKLSTAVSDFAKIYKRVPDEVHIGHFHEYKDISDCDIITTVNGCLDGADDYSISIRKISKPAQNLIIYGDDRCIYNLIAE